MAYNTIHNIFLKVLIGSCTTTKMTKKNAPMPYKIANAKDTIPLKGNRIASSENTIAIEEKTLRVSFFLS